MAKEAHAQVRCRSCAAAENNVCPAGSLSLIVVLIGWSEKGERWGRGPSELPSWLETQGFSQVKAWDSCASAAACWMAGSGPAGWRTFPEGFSGLLFFPQLLSFVAFRSVIKSFGFWIGMCLCSLCQRGTRERTTISHGFLVSWCLLSRLISFIWRKTWENKNSLCQSKCLSINRHTAEKKHSSQI